MRYSTESLQRAQRHAYNAVKNGNSQFRPVPDANITSPAAVRVEIAMAATTSVYNFNFGTNGRVTATTALANVFMGDNDIFTMYGIQILFGIGADQTIREYRTRGVTPSDNCLYNGYLTVKFETNDKVTVMPTSLFREEGDWYPYGGFVLIDPQRRVSGRMSAVQVSLDLGDISGLTLTANPYITVYLHGALGRP